MHLPLRIGTRGSQLALWQARTVAQMLEAAGVAAELVIIKTSGDRLQDAPLSAIGGKRLFVKEIEDALIRDDVDVAVHSAKDMPADLPGGLELAATLPRDDPRDVIVLGAAAPAGDAASVLSRMGTRPRVGTSSVRRSAQLAALIPGAVFAPIRGNVDSRLRKLDQGEYDALVLAAAGMRRLGFADRISTALSSDQCVPAPGQGIIALETRRDDGSSRTAARLIHDQGAAALLDAERAVVASLGGGCQLPLGALAVIRRDTLELHAIVCSPDGSRVVRAREAGTVPDAVVIGQRAAARLKADGASEILDRVRRDSGQVEGSY
jgi:hydroxymethylbilane synthase